jgi:hypothetical protein
MIATVPMSERTSQQLASEMHELSVHLWNALDRERPDYRTSPLRDDIEGIQLALKTIASWTPDADRKAATA